METDKRYLIDQRTLNKMLVDVSSNDTYDITEYVAPLIQEAVALAKLETVKFYDDMYDYEKRFKQAKEDAIKEFINIELLEATEIKSITHLINGLARKYGVNL